MIERYAQKEISGIWNNANKLDLWLKTELAVIEAMENLGKAPKGAYEKISEILNKEPIDLGWWLEEEKKIKHDLNAFVHERLRFLPNDLQIYFHKKITSFDTEESAFARMLKESLEIVEKHYLELEASLGKSALKYRHTVMYGKTHGQGAELQSFGKRYLAWLRDLRVDIDILEKVEEGLRYSKISGTIGNYGSIDPSIEKESLRILGFEPFYGATQIMPREIYAPIAQALTQIMLTLDKIATAIRLGARSGQPIYREKFGETQEGSSTMPHKQNTILTEQIEGMARMARGYNDMIMSNIKTWEERAIEQSCVERIAWPDLFHTVIHSLKTMIRLIKNLSVYPDNMLLEIIESRGCYASSEAKYFLKELGVSYGLTSEEAWKIIQLASFNVFEPTEEAKRMRETLPESFTETDELFLKAQKTPKPDLISIQ